MWRNQQEKVSTMWRKLFKSKKTSLQTQRLWQKIWRSWLLVRGARGREQAATALGQELLKNGKAYKATVEDASRGVKTVFDNMKKNMKETGEIFTPKNIKKHLDALRESDQVAHTAIKKVAIATGTFTVAMVAIIAGVDMTVFEDVGKTITTWTQVLTLEQDILPDGKKALLFPEFALYVYRKINANADGKITEQELKDFFMNRLKTKTEEEMLKIVDIEALIRLINRDGQPGLTKQEFVESPKYEGWKAEYESNQKE